MIGGGEKRKLSGRERGTLTGDGTSRRAVPNGGGNQRSTRHHLDKGINYPLGDAHDSGQRLFGGPIRIDGLDMATFYRHPFPAASYVSSESRVRTEPRALPCLQPIH